MENAGGKPAPDSEEFAHPSTDHFDRFKSLVTHVVFLVE
jgi:hypothetical protein